MEEIRTFEKILKNDYVNIVDQFKKILGHSNGYFFLDYEKPNTEFRFRRHCKIVKSNDSKKFQLYDYLVQKYYVGFVEWASDCGYIDPPKLRNIYYGRSSEYSKAYDLEILIETCNLYEKACLDLVRKVTNKNPKLHKSLYDMLYVFADID